MLLPIKPAKRLFSILLLGSALVLLQACGAVSSSDDPELNDFGIIDTGGSDSADTSDLVVDADEDGGEFTIYWAVDTDDNYQLRVYINDRDRISDASTRTILSMACDPDDDCHEEQTLVCDFDNDQSIECEDFDGNETERDLDHLIDGSSEDLHIIIETCDFFNFGCEDQSVEVEFRN